MMKKTLLTLVAASALTATAQNPIKVNQVGYYVNESKVAVVEPTGKSSNFILKDHILFLITFMDYTTIGYNRIVCKTYTF